MNVANIELCKELYELSGWVGAGAEWSDWYSGELEYGKGNELYQGDWRVVSTAPWRDANTTPAYDLGYLLRKLPKFVKNSDFWLNNDGLSWTAGYMTDDFRDSAYWTVSERAETPEDAAAKLAIELFKQGILTKEES